MKKALIAICIVTSCFFCCKQTQKKEIDTAGHEANTNADIEDAFSIEILDDEALQLIDPNASITVRAQGFAWTEGPLWIEDGKYLLFSDIPNNKVYRLEQNNDTITYLHPSGYTDTIPSTSTESGSNGLLLDNDGRLVLMQQGDRRVGRMKSPVNDPKPEFEVLVDNYMGEHFNSPNDGIFDKNGNLYFTDPPYGLPEQMDDPKKELDFQGVYCLLKDGTLVLLDKLSRPNGITMSPDQTKLYIAVSDHSHAVWYRYTIDAPGKLSGRNIFYDVTHLVGKKGHQGLPDGIKTSSKGYLYATGPGGVWIFNDAAKPLARIHTGQATSNCALSADEKQLFMTADDYVLSVALK